MPPKTAKPKTAKPKTAKRPSTASAPAKKKPAAAAGKKKPVAAKRPVKRARYDTSIDATPGNGMQFAPQSQQHQQQQQQRRSQTDPLWECRKGAYNAYLKDCIKTGSCTQIADKCAADSLGKVRSRLSNAAGAEEAMRSWSLNSLWSQPPEVLLPDEPKGADGLVSKGAKVLVNEYRRCINRGVRDTDDFQAMYSSMCPSTQAQGQAQAHHKPSKKKA